MIEHTITQTDLVIEQVPMTVLEQVPVITTVTVSPDIVLASSDPVVEVIEVA